MGLRAVHAAKAVAQEVGQRHLFLSHKTGLRQTALLDQIGQMDEVHRTQTSIVLSRKIDRRSVAA